MPMSSYIRDAWANSIRGGGAGTSFTAPGTIYGQLHTGDPGLAGTNNIAGETTRQEVQFGAAGSGAIQLSNSPQWVNVAASETWVYMSLWSASSGGDHLGYGSLTTPKAVIAAETHTLAALSYTLA